MCVLNQSFDHKQTNIFNNQENKLMIVSSIYANKIFISPEFWYFCKNLLICGIYGGFQVWGHFVWDNNFWIIFLGIQRGSLLILGESASCSVIDGVDYELQNDGGEG
jgi:hypothetical protein